MTFSVSTTLETQVSEPSLRQARDTIESELGDIQVGVDGGDISSQLGGGMLPDGGVAAAGGAGILDALDEQTEWLQEIHDTLEKGAVSAGGGGGLLGGIMPGGKGGGSGFLSGILTGTVALKAKEIISITGRYATKAKNVLAMTGVLSLSAPQVLAVGSVLALTAGSVLAVKDRYKVRGAEILAIGSVLTVGAASLLAIGSVISVPAAALITITGGITLGVAEIVKRLPPGPSDVKTDGRRTSTKPGATSGKTVKDIGSFRGGGPESASETTDWLVDQQDEPPVKGPGVDLNRAKDKQPQRIQLDISQKIAINDKRKLEQRLDKLAEKTKRKILRELDTDATL